MGGLSTSMSAHLKAPKSKRSSLQSEETDDGPSTSELLELLGDEYTRRVFEVVTEQPLSGREVTEATDVSRPTAYRRLNALRDAGLVTTEMAISQEGHHREKFEAAVKHIDISLAEDGIEAEVIPEH